MKSFLTILMILIAAVRTDAWIVHNSATSPTGEDSLSVPFQALDSLGNPTTADSVFVTVAGPSGSIVFIDSMTTADTRITRATVGGKTVHIFRCQVSNIDGPGIPGVYALTITAHTVPLDLCTSTLTGFQLVEAELSDRLALLDDTVWVNGGAIDSNRTERGLSLGSGATSIVLIAVDSSTNQVIPGVRVALRNLDQTALLGLGLTDITGAAAFNIDPGSFIAVTVAPGYQFAPFDTVTVSGPTIDTLFGLAWYPEPPASANLCRVWGYLYGIDGSPQTGATIRASLSNGVARFNGSIVAPTPVTAITDSSGLFQIDLIPSSLLQASDTRYDLSITRTDGVILHQRITIPDEPLWQLTW